MLRVAIIGGGVSGLAAAHRLRTLLPSAELRLFEASDRLGGPLSTLRDGELVLELGADSFLAKNGAVVDLCRELGLADELIPTSEQHRRALVVCRGKLEPIPEGFVLMRPTRLGPVLRSPILSPAGKLRVLCEPLIGRHPQTDAPGHDESIERFAVRRLGRETFERLVEPLMGGIYVGDASRLSLAATMPEFLEAERVHGSLWGAVKAGTASGAGPRAPSTQYSVPSTQYSAPSTFRENSTSADEGRSTSGARYSAFLTLRRGLGSLVDALAAGLPAGCAQLNSPVASLQRTAEGSGGWSVEFADGRPAEQFQAIVVAAPAPQAARLLQGADSQLAGLLHKIEYASSAVISLLYRRSQFPRPLDAFGFVVPQIERRQLVAASFPSVKFPGRGDPDLVPIRAFLGGALQPEMVDLPDDELIAIADRELRELLNLGGPPEQAIVARWRPSMPQYYVRHVQLVERIETLTAAHPGLALAGNAYHGVGIPRCIASGRAAAEKTLTLLSNAPAGPEE